MKIGHQNVIIVSPYRNVDIQGRTVHIYGMPRTVTIRFKDSSIAPIIVSLSLSRLHDDECFFFGLVRMG